MVLSDAILEATRDLFVRVFIGGVRLLPTPHGPESLTTQLPFTNLQISKGIDQPVPVATIDVAGPMPRWLRRGRKVDIVLGFNNLGAKVFRGTVQRRQRRAGGGTIHCQGQSGPAFELVEIPERDVDGQTVEQAIEGILDYVGITVRNLISIPAFTLGSASTPVLERSTADQMLNQLFEIDGLFMYEDGTGTVTIRQTPLHPAPTAFRTYATNDVDTARIVGGGDDEDPSWFRTKIVVTGATIVEGSAPDQTSRTITATAQLLNSPLVQPPLPAGTTRDLEFSNHLIDTDAKAANVAARLMTVYGRVPRTITIELPGDPELEIGQTIGLDFAEIDCVMRGIVIGLQHTVNAQSGYHTTVTIRGGDEFAGDVAVAPIADFDYEIQRLIIDDRVYAVVTFNGYPSFDPDGTVISSYAWSDNKVTTPEIATLTTPWATVRVDPSGLSGWEVTLTVTDASGLTGAITKAIDVPATSTLVNIPSVFVANDNNASCSPDGGGSWENIAGSTCRSVAARRQDGSLYGIALYGFEDGHISRTVDYCRSTLTTVLAAVGSPIVDIIFDWRDYNVVWALAENWNLYISLNGGATFGLVSPMAAGFGMGAGAKARRIRILPIAGSPWCFGGDGANRPVIGYRLANGNFTKLSFGGDLEADLPAVFSADVRIVDAVDKGDGSGFFIIMENADGGTGDVRPVYRAANPFVAASWQRATGFEAGSQQGRYIVATPLNLKFLAALNDRHIWKTTDGIAWTQMVNVMPLNVTPNHAIWSKEDEHNPLLGSFHLIAAEEAGALSKGIYLTIDEGASVQVLWPATGAPAWPTSAKGRKVALGPELGRTSRLLALCRVGTAASGYQLTRQNEAIWNIPATYSSSLHMYRPRCTSALVWFGFRMANKTDYANVATRRTEDGGGTWATLSAPAASYVWQDIQRAADGRLWGVAVLSSDLGHWRVYYSDDDGDTWTQSLDTSSTNQRLCRIICHPTNQSRIAILGGDAASQVDCRVRYTTDRGATWATNNVTNVFSADPGHEMDVLQLPSNRLILAGPKSSTVSRIISSDDSGLAWTERKLFTTNYKCLGPVGTKSGERLFVLVDTGAGNVTQIWQSTTQGSTWADLGNNPPRFAAAEDHRGGIAFDERDDAVYVMSEGDATRAGAGIKQAGFFYRLAPPEADATWDDLSIGLTLALDNTGPVAASFGQHLAVIP